MTEEPKGDRLVTALVILLVGLLLVGIGVRVLFVESDCVLTISSAGVDWTCGTEPE